MSTEYDSAKIRALSGQIRKIATETAEVRRVPLTNVLREIPGNFRGTAANALEESVTELVGDVSGLSARLDAICDALNTLADQLDEADRRAKAAIESR